MTFPSNQTSQAARHTVIPNQVQLLIRHRGSMNEAQIDALIASINTALNQGNPSLGANLSRVRQGGAGDNRVSQSAADTPVEAGAPLPALTFQHRRAGFTVVLLDAGLPDDNARRLAELVRAINALGARQPDGQTGEYTVGKRRTQADDALVGLAYRFIDSLMGAGDDRPTGGEGLQGPAFSAAPNRLQSASHHGGGFGGPGTWPIQPATMSGDFVQKAVNNGLLQKLTSAGARQPVTVAVLDTWLSAGEVTQALASNWAQSLLQPGSGVSFVNHLRLAPAERALLAGRRAVEPNAHPYLMRSHGLFAVSQIRRLAPDDIPIMVYEALDEFGMGTDFHILQILWHLADTYRSSNLVINLSLTVRPLPEEAPTILPDGTSSMEYASLTWGNEEPFNPLQAICRMLTLEGAVIIAAAGNDSFDLSLSVPPKKTAAPASYASVIAVGAVEPAADGSFPRARYSNLSGKPLPGDPSRREGFMAVGAGVSNANQPPPVVVDGLLPTPDVSGMFIDADYPTGTIAAPTPAPNTSGIVYWGGTSFATAKVTGLVAALLSAGRIRPTSGCGCWPFANLLTQQTTKDAVVNVLHRDFVRKTTPGFFEPVIEI